MVRKDDEQRVPTKGRRYDLQHRSSVAGFLLVLSTIRWVTTSAMTYMINTEK